MSSRKHFLLVAVGSAGDVFPMVSIGASLGLRGHQVTVVGPPVNREFAIRNGIDDYVPISSDNQYASSLKDKYLLETRYHGLFLLRYAVAWNTTIYTEIRLRACPELRILSVDRPNVWGDLLAHTQLKIPLLRVSIDLPITGEDRSNVMTLPAGRPQQRLMASWFHAWNENMQQLGVHTGTNQPMRLFRRVRPSVPTIGLWPDSITGGWGKRAGVQSFGFVPPSNIGVDKCGTYIPQPDRKVVVFVAGTEGTTKDWLGKFIKVSIQVCKCLGCDGVVVGGEVEDITDEFPPFFTWEKFRPLSTLLPYSSVIVHHGGIGTAAAALKYGVPQLVIPRVFAQPYNAERLQRMGLCVVMPPKSYTVSNATEQIRAMLANVDIPSQIRKVYDDSKLEVDMPTLCEFLEKWELKSKRS